ncbi:carbohydrate-binding protein [Streptomyces pathocidini]|uniref:Carbohydrate-binding protein n=1 Tax=Streptomyces pathocidini TaxID=1650571 RepID=A0ABW7UTL6_9ACTN
MTAGNNGANTPENDDPFAYLYRSEGGTDADASAPAAPSTGGYGYPHQTAQPGVPRTSYHQVSRVGERRYGGQQAPNPYGQQHGNQSQSPNPHYAAPETLPGGAPHQPASHGHGGHGGGRGPNSKGLLIGAIAVVAAVVIGIGVAMLSNGGGGKDEADGPTQSTGGASQESQGPSEAPAEPDKDDAKPFASKKVDAASLRIKGPTTAASDIQGARSETGSYLMMSGPGASATWTVNVPKDGQYTLFVGYSVPGKDAATTLVLNSKVREAPTQLKNYAMAKEGAWDKGWTRSFAYVELNKGTNTIEFYSMTDNQTQYALDQVWLKEGQVKG